MKLVLKNFAFTRLYLKLNLGVGLFLFLIDSYIDTLNKTAPSVKCSKRHYPEI